VFVQGFGGAAWHSAGGSGLLRDPPPIEPLRAEAGGSGKAAAGEQPAKRSAGPLPDVTARWTTSFSAACKTIALTLQSQARDAAATGDPGVEIPGSSPLPGLRVGHVLRRSTSPTFKTVAGSRNGDRQQRHPGTGLQRDPDASDAELGEWPENRWTRRTARRCATGRKTAQPACQHGFGAGMMDAKRRRSGRRCKSSQRKRNDEYASSTRTTERLANLKCHTRRADD